MESKYDESDIKQGIQPPHDINEPLIVKISTIPGAGYGLFANKRIKKGEHITRYTGEKQLNNKGTQTMKENMSCMSCATCMLMQ